LIGCHHGDVAEAWVAWDDGEIDGEGIWETGYDVSFQGEGSSVENYRVASWARPWPRISA
jgi:hypothetical protein